MPLLTQEQALEVEIEFRRLAAEAGVKIPKNYDLESQGWQVWLKTLSPSSFSAPFSVELIEFWDLYWDLLIRLKRGEVVPAEERSIILPLGRGNAKSTTAEMAAIAEGCILGQGLTLYLSDSQLLAEEHLYSIKAILENGIFAEYYPSMATPVMESSTGSKTAKYTQDTIHTNNGRWGATARGLTANVRGGRLGTLRFTLVICDDIDNLTDSLMVIEKKKRILSRTVFPAMAKSGKMILAQNLITKNSIASQILNRKTDILSERTIIGGGKAVKAFKELELDQVFTEKGAQKWVITHAVPTWDYFNLEDARSFLGMSGKEAFLAEYQHEFDEKRGKVIPNYNEEAQVITWSMFESVYRTRFIPRDWNAACGLDVGFSDGMHPHYSYWGFMATSGLNSQLPNKQFLYRGRAFIATAIDDQAVEIWQDLIRGADFSTNLFEFPTLHSVLDVPHDFPMQRGGVVHHWQMSHEATGVMLTLNMKYGMPFGKVRNYKATDGVAQWNHMSRCDYSVKNPFKEDEQLDDGTWLIGCPTLFYIVDDDQLTLPRDEKGLKLFREQVAGWEYVPTKILESGLAEEKPSKIDDDSCDVIKGLCDFFGQPATALTAEEAFMANMPEHMRNAETEGEKISRNLWLQAQSNIQKKNEAQKQATNRSMGLRQFERLRGK